MWSVSKMSDCATRRTRSSWSGAAQQGRVVVSVDKKTLAVDAWDRVARGLPMPGVAILRILLAIGQAIHELETIALAGNLDDFRDQVIYLPM
jgi:hypothetical protein